ncbi:MAG: class I SAM-dependent methyltransferase [Mesorhizobium sp.]|nr:MAG: class I SAM-dependent methyltransferase [Mesorhizobium sp.]
MLTSQTLGPRAFLKSLGFALDKKPHQIDRLLLKALSPECGETLQMIWASRNAGFSDGLGTYLLPKSLKQAALQFSYDWPRAAATMDWFDQVIGKLGPASVVEMGCGAGFLLGYLRSRYPGVHLQGVDAAKNLVEVGSELAGTTLIAGDYLTAAPDGAYDLILCDFGFDMARLKPSTTPHTIEASAGAPYCPGCSNDLKFQFDAYLQAWRRWSHPHGHLAVAGRFSNFGILRAFVLSASDVGWQPELEASTILAVKQHGNAERFPALLFKPVDTVRAEPDFEMIARFFVS